MAYTTSYISEIDIDVIKDDLAQWFPYCQFSYTKVFGGHMVVYRCDLRQAPVDVIMLPIDIDCYDSAALSIIVHGFNTFTTVYGYRNLTLNIDNSICKSSGERIDVQWAKDLIQKQHALALLKGKTP